MSNTTPLTPKNFGPPPVGLDDEPDDVLQGARPSFAVVIMPDKGQWGIRYQRNDWLYRDDNENPIGNFEVVIIKSRENLSNKFYPNWDAAAKNRPPDCFASDGKTPDSRVDPATRQHAICEGCPQKKPGSAYTASGKATTACRNERKIAVVPLMHFTDKKYEEYGGPALFTITPTSLKNYSEYVDRVKALGQKAFSVVTRMRFDPTVKHQKIIFTPYRVLSQEEFEQVKELRRDPRTARVLDEEPLTQSYPPDDDYDPETGEITPAPKPPAPPAPATTKAPPPPPAPAARTLPPGPPKPGGFAATAQTVNAAMGKPAQRPPSVRAVETPPVEEDEYETHIDEEDIDDGLNPDIDDELKRLLSND